MVSLSSRTWRSRLVPNLCPAHTLDTLMQQASHGGLVCRMRISFERLCNTATASPSSPKTRSAPCAARPRSGLPSAGDRNRRHHAVAHVFNEPAWGAGLPSRTESSAPHFPSVPPMSFADTSCLRPGVPKRQRLRIWHSSLCFVSTLRGVFLSFFLALSLLLCWPKPFSSKLFSCTCVFFGFLTFSFCVVDCGCVDCALFVPL